MANAYYTLLNAVKNQIDSLGLGVPTSIRSNVFVVEGDTPPLIIVSASDDHEDIRFNTMSRSVVYDYKIMVVLLWPANRLIDSALNTYLEIRDAIRNQLYQIEAAGFAISFDTNIDMDSVSNFSAFKNSNYQISGFTLRYSVTEKRKGY